MQYVKKHAVYERTPMGQCWKETGKNPINTGWADTNKGTSECANVRCRWVAKEYNTGPRPDLFSATSLLKEVLLIISEASSNQKGTVLLVIDVSVLLCAGEAQSPHGASRRRRRRSRQSVGSVGF